MLNWLYKLWSVTKFDCKEQTNYAVDIMIKDTQNGVMTMSAVSVFLYAIAAVIYSYLAMPSSYLYTHGVLMLLSIHIGISARASNDLKALYLLAMTLLIVGSVAIVLLAHHTGSFSVGIFGFMILLFSIIPLVPWGLREAVIVISLIYIVFTFSTASVSGRFEDDTLLLMQFLMVGAGITSLSIVVRNVVVRKDDILMRYNLVQAHSEKELLSLRDPLTGAWNRRFLDDRFASIASAYRAGNQGLNFALLDLDHFKQINDQYGHDFGDRVLKRFTEHFSRNLKEEDYFIRLGGDEFAIVYTSEQPMDIIEQGIKALQCDAELLDICRSVNTSVGLVTVSAQQRAFLEDLYKQADKALYKAKKLREANKDESHTVSQVLGVSVFS